MVDASHLSRRRVLQGGIALGALGVAGLPAGSAYAAPAATPRLPARGNIGIFNFSPGSTTDAIVDVVGWYATT